MTNFKGLEDYYVKFFYLREPCSREGHRGKPVVTVCLLTDNKKKLVARGIAICSEKDLNSKAYNKKVGRSIALKRACKAWFRKEYDRPIEREEAYNAVELAIQAWFDTYNNDFLGADKATVVPIKNLSKLERAIIGK